MKKILLSLLLLSGVSTFAQTSHTIVTSGFNFSPNNITIPVGDTIKFTVGSNHNSVEVSEATWNANGSTALQGGFSVGFGGTAKFKLTQAKTYYYVCSPHAGSGMKGKIVVTPATSIFDKTSAIQSFSVYPNPVTAASVIRLELSQPSEVQVKIYNLLGALLHQEKTEKLNVGDHTIPFSGHNLAQGMYLLEVTLGSQRIVKKIAVR